MGKKSKRKPSQQQQQQPSSSSTGAIPTTTNGMAATSISMGSLKIDENSQIKKLSLPKQKELNQLVNDLLKFSFQSVPTINDQWNQYIGMKTLLVRIQKIESEMCPSVGGGGGIKHRQACIETFMNWIQENGGECAGIKISEYSGYELGLEATKDFDKDECFVMIPRKLFMLLVNVNNDIAPLLAELPTFDSMLNIKLAFNLMVEKLSPNSFWKPYIDVLPDRYSTVMNFKVSEMQELKGSNALGAAIKQCVNIMRQYAFIRKHLHTNSVTNLFNTSDTIKSRFTFDLYAWAVSAAMTRLNNIPKQALSLTLTSSSSSPSPEIIEKKLAALPDDIPALIPLWDMANHTQGHITSDYSIENGGRIEATTLQPYKKGEQILIFYGKRSNADFLIHNGFVDPNNQYDRVLIPIGLSEKDPLLKSRIRILDLLQMQKNGEFEVLPIPICISSKLLAFARIFNMNAEHLEHWATNGRHEDLLHIDCALDTSIETKTWTFLKMRLMLLLRAFPTTLDEDMQLMVNHRKGQNRMGHIKAMLVQFRVCEKRILSDALDYADQRTKS